MLWLSNFWAVGVGLQLNIVMYEGLMYLGAINSDNLGLSNEIHLIEFLYIQQRNRDNTIT